MGTSRTDYLFYGKDVGYGNAPYEEFEKEMYQEDGARFDMISDSMSGKYAFAGKIIAKSDGYEGFENIIAMPDLTEDKFADIDDIIREHFPENMIACQLFLFTHWH